jgi:hypothetical protein
VKGFGALPLVGQGFFFNPQWRKVGMFKAATLVATMLTNAAHKKDLPAEEGRGSHMSAPML